MSVFQQRLRYIMFAKGIRQRDIVEHSGIDKSKISRYVSGQNIPSGDTLAKLANALGVSAAWLAGEGPDLTPEETARLVRERYSESRVYETDSLVAKSIPVVGKVAAGEPIFAWENMIGTVMVKDMRPGLFALRINGDSMAPRIMNGDLVIVQQQDTADDGDIVIALVDDEATCKVLKRSAWGIMLVPFNSAYAPMVYAGEEAERLHIVGKVIESRHKWE